MDKHLLGYKGAKGTVIVLALLILIQGISIVYMAKGLAEVISALFEGHALREQKGPLLVFLLAFLTRQMTSLLQQKTAQRFAQATAADMRRKLMERLFRHGPRLIRAEGTGNVVTLVLEGVSQFRTYLELILPRMIGTVIIPVILLGYIFLLDGVSGIILVVTMPILIAFLILIGLAARKQMDRQWTSYRTLSNHFVDSLRGLETLKFLGRSRSHSHTIGQVSDKYRSATLRTLRVAFLSSFALDFFAMLSVASVAVSLGLRLVQGHMTLAVGLTVLILAPEYFLPVRMIGADYHASLRGKEAGKAIHAIIGHTREASVSSASSESGPPPDYAWTHKSTLALASIHVRHEAEGPYSLQDVSFKLQGMRKIGIIGESGAGKSTLIDVLGGFLPPSSGYFELDGHHVCALNGDFWRQQMVYLPQHPYIFNRSLADNVRFYAPDASQEEVERAVAAAGLSNLVAALPHGMDEAIGNGGRRLSGGQEQRIALARAFLSDRPIVLLDEPTAHLDIETEYELKETMLSLFADRLVFLATHRLHWMPDMDQIIVLDKGRVAETGTHEELIAQKGLYFQMLASQREGIL